MEEGSIRPVSVNCGRSQGTSPAELVVPEEDPVPEEEAGPALAAATEACGQSRAGRSIGAGRSSRACATDTATLEDHAEDAQKRAKGFQNGKEEYIGKTKRNGMLASQHTGRRQAPSGEMRMRRRWSRPRKGQRSAAGGAEDRLNHVRGTAARAHPAWSGWKDGRK